MKKTEKVTIPEQVIPSKTKTKDVYTCDCCGGNINTHYIRINHCHICGRDICKKCSYDDPYDYGDYPNGWCRHCYNLWANNYEQKFTDLIEKHEQEYEAIMEKLKQESLGIMQ